MSAPETPATPGQAATPAQAYWEAYVTARDGGPASDPGDISRWENLPENLRGWIESGIHAAIAARQPQPAPGDVPAGIRSAVTGLIGMWDGMRKVHAPSDGEWEDWRAVLGGLVEELASQLDGGPQPAPGCPDPSQHVVIRDFITGHELSHAETDGQQPAPELAAAIPAAQAALARVLSWFKPEDKFDSYRYARATRAQLASACKDGELDVPEELRRYL